MAAFWADMWAPRDLLSGLAVCRSMPTRARGPRIPPLLSILALFLAAGSLLSSCTRRSPDIGRVIREATQEDLVRFDSDADLRRYVREMSAALRERRRLAVAAQNSADAQGMAQPSAAPPSEASESEADEDSGDGESITNNQEDGVDEGGIVKVHGDHLVVLRRGRLFSVRLDAGRLVPISQTDAYPQGSSLDTWYDEMLIHDDTIVVVGFSYGAGATEIGLFDIDDQGHIRHRSTHFLRSNDYYSSRNYASRLLGDKLVFYMPYGMFQERWDGDEPVMQTSLPGVRDYNSSIARDGQGDSDDWARIIRSTDIYQPIQQTETPVLHTVVTCDLSQPGLDCTAQGILGPYGRNFYVSRSAVYVWVHGGHSRFGEQRQEVAETNAVVYRLPLNGEPPGALRVSGAPTDQFSFKESSDGHLNVLVRAEGGGDWMWSPEATQGDVALLRVPVAGFSTRVGTVRTAAYTDLPRPERGWSFQNRFVGDHVLYGTGSGWGAPEDQRDDRVFVHPYAAGRTAQTTAIELPHGVDRLEALGSNAVVVGTDGANLHFTALDLSGTPAIGDRYVQRDAAQGETRSHGFFFKPDGDGGGVLGLPIRQSSGAGYEQLMYGSASVLYLRVNGLHFSPVGTLAAHADRNPDDGCVMSCVDWYGNARPIFYRGRVFALLGYELVEGRIDGGQMAEVRRTMFLQGGRRAAR